MLHHASVKAIQGPEPVANVEGNIGTSSAALRATALRQALAGVMQEARSILRGVHHLEFADVERILLGHISAPALLQAGQNSQAFRFADSLAGEQAAQHRVAGAPAYLGQHIDQKFRLRAVVRRVAVDLEETREAVHQVIDGGCEVRSVIAATPLVETQAVALVFLQRRGVEDANHVIIYAHRLHRIGAFSCRPPIKSVDILQHGENLRVRH